MKSKEELDNEINVKDGDELGKGGFGKVLKCQKLHSLSLGEAIQIIHRPKDPVGSIGKKQLNPAWVETLMGFPQGWTCLNSPKEED